MVHSKKDISGPIVPRAGSSFQTDARPFPRAGDNSQKIFARLSSSSIFIRKNNEDHFTKHFIKAY
jgi:hypothetical protein